MKATSSFQLLNVDELIFDKSNPRISQFIETHGEDVDPADIGIVLATGEQSFIQLRDAIRTTGGVINPIIVRISDEGKKIVIEGNTRLAIYKDFLKNEEGGGDWSTIPCAVYDGIEAKEIDAIRLQAHLVGTREWKPYAKGKYLYYLYNKEYMPLPDLVSFCGGRKSEVIRMIEAYKDMHEYFVEGLKNYAFDEKKFSAFVELQKPKIKTSLIHAGYSISDFAQWVYDEKFDRLEHVRELPSILSDADAKDIFFKQGSKAAKNSLETPDMSDALKETSILKLCLAISYKMDNISATELDKIKNSEEKCQLIVDTAIELEVFASNWFK